MALSTHKSLFKAVKSFLRDNSIIESRRSIDNVVDEIGKCTTMENLFTIPIKRRIINFDSALRWVMFLIFAPDTAEIHDGVRFQNINADKSLRIIYKYYDLAMEEIIESSFESDSETEESNNKK